MGSRGVRTVPGGTMALLGLMLIGVGGWVVASNITVHSSWSWHLFGMNAHGVLFVPFVVGVIMGISGKMARLGWFVAICSVVAAVVGVLVNTRFTWHSTSLAHTLGIVAMPATGLGLLIRAVAKFERSTDGGEKASSREPLDGGK